MDNHTVLSRRTFGSVAAVAALALATTGAATAATPTRQAAAGTAPLTNLSHLDFLLAEVPLLAVEGHTTWQIAERPQALAPWTYADGHPDGSYTPVGGGTEDPATGYWSQGAYNADDISRTAVVYLRHWTQTGNAASRDKALDLLRDLAFLQTATGPDAGNVILWQQPDGTLNPSAEPVELPDPSDSAESYWLARTVWAFGEGYAAFLATNPAFASFLQERLGLALASLNKQSLAKYGTYDTADGVPVPAWLIAGGADASAEAVLGLTAYVKAAPGDAVAARALLQLGEGIAAMSAGSTGEWPFGAIMPWTKSRSLWHAWGGMAPAAAAGAGTLLNRQDFLAAALLDSAQFTPQLLVSGGPDNAWSPVPGEAQIAYGVDSRLQGLVATAAAAGSPGLLELAAVVAGWYFGANKSGLPAYNPATGTAIDGIETDGRDRPDSDGTSRLSPALRWGHLSPVQVWEALGALAARDEEAAAGARAIMRQLAWRDFCWNQLYHQPDMGRRNLRPEFDEFDWSWPTELLPTPKNGLAAAQPPSGQHDPGQDDPGRDEPGQDDPGQGRIDAFYEAWCRGETGFPLVDAGMRQLWEIGWMHNRVRMVTASLLVKNLGIHWRAGEAWFWDTLVDADAASNPANWQWVAGSGADASPYFRVFNPVLQAKKFDPRGSYQARFAPVLGQEPLVDLKESRTAALDAYDHMKQAAQSGGAQH